MWLRSCCSGSQDVDAQKGRNTEKAVEENGEMALESEPLLTATFIEEDIKSESEASEDEMEYSTQAAERPVSQWTSTEVMDFLSQETHDEFILIEACQRLTELSNKKSISKKILGSNGYDLIFNVFNKYQKQVATQIALMETLSVLGSKTFSRSHQATVNGFEYMSSALSENKELDKFVKATLNAVAAICLDHDKHVEFVLKTNMVEQILTEMRLFLRKENGFLVEAEAITALHNISLTRADAIRARQTLSIIEALQKYPDKMEVAHNAVLALTHICADEDNARCFISNNGFDTIKGIWENKHTHKSQKLAIMNLYHTLVLHPSLSVDLYNQSAAHLLEMLKYSTSSHLVENALKVWVAYLLSMEDKDLKRRIGEDMGLAILNVLSVDAIEESAQDMKLQVALMIAILLQCSPRDKLSDSFHTRVVSTTLTNWTKENNDSEFLEFALLSFYELSRIEDNQNKLIEMGIADLLGNMAESIADGSVVLEPKTLKIYARTVKLLFSNVNHYQLLMDYDTKLMAFVNWASDNSDIEEYVRKIESFLEEMKARSTVNIVVSLDESKESQTRVGQVDPNRVNVTLTVGSEVMVNSKSENGMVPAKIVQITDSKINLQYNNKRKWLSITSKKWKPKQYHVDEAGLTRSGQVTITKKTRKLPEYEASVSVETMFDDDYDVVEPEPIAEDDGHEDDFAIRNTAVSMAIARAMTPPPPTTDAPPQIKAHLARQRSQFVVASDDFIDFEVEFPSQRLGLVLRPQDNGINCVADRCLTEFAQTNIDTGSVVTQVNGVWVLGKPFDTIYQMLSQAAQNPPTVISFRCPKGPEDENDRVRFGTLKIHVTHALQLASPGQYAKIKIGDVKKTTDVVEASENPSWSNTLVFPHFSPGGRVAEGQVGIYGRAFMKDKNIGKATFELPTRFHQLKRYTLSLSDKKRGQLTGVVEVSVLISKKRTVRNNSENDE